METEEEINAKIMKVTMVIQENYPELSKYLNEMPITIPIDSNPEINVKNLQKYYDTLVALFRNYVAEHQLNYINQRTGTGHL
ncbi:hypothetical protein [Flavobacterium aquatile]|uniref:Uncharacterized protein n=1 Tax=Flavobacterium aquatile LMG 4008 = ATCC 11947 TaxID=1453498 RepID=A0A095SST1_9FLAO|nr:hypothetical protein [Flavobacterium aquatile]KGD67424.1 hypothetical protein LG45_14560 [Flavobacterium aquatile LMG 4008 = ATCC 11947]OXA66961.1 hypothetical protein B0A61_09455 [Flavobacterium aquatile LMG 4008 = ATCC 11947]GEC78786.1 hypothetical protein FAQ01_16560 [Flavobacterium aquatile]